MIINTHNWKTMTEALSSTFNETQDQQNSKNEDLDPPQDHKQSLLPETHKQECKSPSSLSEHSPEHQILLQNSILMITPANSINCNINNLKDS